MNGIIITPQVDKNTVLEAYGISIRGYLIKGAEAIYLAGKELFEVRSLCEHGEWLQWLKKEFPLTPRTAQRYIDNFKRVQEEYKQLAMAPLSILEDGEPPALLIPASVDNENLFRQAAVVVDALASDPIRTKVQAGEIGVVAAARSITKAPDPVRTASQKWKVSDPGVMDVLTRLAETLPDEFSGVDKSGVMQWPSYDERPPKVIPLDKITASEARECYTALRREEGIIEHEANSFQPVVDTTCTIQQVTEGDHFMITIEVDERSFRRLQKLQNTKQRLIIKPANRG